VELDLKEERYHRQELIEWWDQKRVAQARVLVIGAGALGNEVLKLLALTGVGHTLVYDPDIIEKSNLSRTVLFRESDEGKNKAEVAAVRASEINPDVAIYGRPDNVITRTGLGVFLWADVIIGAVDNREARVFVNSAAARAGRRWVDGAIEGFSGIVRAFDPSDGACYECTMNATDRKMLAERRSCALLARDVVARGHVPTTAVSASIIAAMEVQEAVKLLHGQPALIGEGLHVNGLWSESSRVKYPRKEDCPGHERLPTVEPLGVGTADVKLGDLLARAERELGQGAAIDLSRDVITRLSCPDCGDSVPGRAVLGAVRERDARCPRCQAHRVVEITASITRDDPNLDLGLTFADLGIPPFDVVVARQGFDDSRAWLFSGDAAAALGPLEASFHSLRRVA
jgi:molybdopterin/thiamine biosynthesis adenylyltransferase